MIWERSVLDPGALVVFLWAFGTVSWMLIRIPIRRWEVRHGH